MGHFDQALEKLEFDKILKRILRYASSDPGRDLVSRITLLTSLEQVRCELQRVNELKKLLEQESALPLDGIYPTREAVAKSSIDGTVLTPKELWHTLSTLRAARVLRQFIGKRREAYPLLWEIAEPLHIDRVLEYNLDQAIDENGNVKGDASKELLSIRRTLADKYEETKKRLATILRNVADLGFAQDEIITTREGRMVIPVKAEHKNRVHGFIHSASASGATVFIEPSDTLDLNNEIRNLQFQEQREIERILRELTIQVGHIRDQLLANSAILAELDLLHAKAKYSIEILGVAPEVTETGPLKFVEARHPILLQSHGRDGTVPLNLELGSSYNTLVISGPNAGGKSVAMKSVGLLTLMAQCGMHIPASDQSVLRIFKDMFVDIGDEQSIENDLSTFSSHLRNLKAIDEQAGSNSLVLIDEIGSGTDPAEGGAIAAAILESLTKRGTYTIATTHHSSLKVFAHNTEGVENGAMEFDQTTLTPTFKFTPAIPGSSYALEMAQRIGLKEDMLSRSREFMGHHQARLEQLIANLELSAQKYRNQLYDVRAEKSRLDSLVLEYESKLSSLASELKELKRKAVEEAKGIVDNANALIERSIREIKERSADKESVRAVREEVKKVQDEIEIATLRQEEAMPKSDFLEIGSAVRLSGGVETGEVAGLSPDGKSAIVLFGSLKMKVPTKDLVMAKKIRSTSFRPSAIESEKPAEVVRDIDLRGMTSEEAVPLVDKFIDTAILTGLHRVDIIHGKGTGALRKKVTEFLSHHPRVKSYRLAEWNEGGSGATVVELADA
ncbi:MAG: endonuclease MutS2 [Bacteroidetes bacterium]|nr:endonuclease MutS2 [Bacteroidota bacterium]MCW5896310.1 endonuclease MutS2 [Bacteroidota bacterium]